jgi:5,10-methenyltetrahydromethanopterin hydrogenase
MIEAILWICIGISAGVAMKIINKWIDKESKNELLEESQQEPTYRFELIGHADLSINNIYIFTDHSESVPEGRTPIYAGYRGDAK